LIVPIVFLHKGFRFFFFSNEGDPREPMHIHIRKGTQLAKFWIRPRVQLAESFGFSAAELNRLVKIVEARQGEVEEAWNAHFGI
jgi:hypothetical protein